MILVRRRNAFFEAMIRALKMRGVKVAGADRLKLRDHIAVMDLIAAGHAALARDDDLTLACVLKSPLIGLDENALYALAAGRPASLAAALAASEVPWTQAAQRRLEAWRDRAARFGPYTFYARIIGEDGGRKALIARLGEDAAEPIDEFLALALAHERSEAPSLTRFLAEVEEDEAEIKRDLEAESEGVRVLTVHASKGLEAPIVFLPDTAVAPGGQHDPKLMPLSPEPPDKPPLFAWSRRSAEDCVAVAEARKSRRRAEAGEHRRLLYVAMTRAAERLIVAGYETLKRRPEACWYDLVAKGLANVAYDAPAFWDERAVLRRFGEALVADCGRDAAPAEGISLPNWLTAAAAPESAVPRLHPSETIAQRDGAQGRQLEGVLAHALLQLLPTVEPARRAEAAQAYLSAHGAALSNELLTALASKVLAALGSPELQQLFGPGSRAEVPFAGVLRRWGRQDLRVTGRVDRLVVTEEAVILADFKLGSAPAGPKSSHVAQLAIYRAALAPNYPSRQIVATLVYLDDLRMIPLSNTDLDAALNETVTL